MLDLRAAHRLLASERTRLRSSQSKSIEDMGDVLEAGFDKQRDPELQKIELHLRKANVFFTLSQGHLYHKSNAKDIDRETEICVEELQSLSYQLRVQPGILVRQNFAVKGKDGIVLQRLGNNLRIFFSV
jgi:hypothetical protein